MKAPSRSIRTDSQARKFAELTRQGEDDNLLVGPLLGSVVVDGETAGLDVALLLSPGDVANGRMSVGIQTERTKEALTRRQRSRGTGHLAGEAF